MSLRGTEGEESIKQAVVRCAAGVNGSFETSVLHFVRFLCLITYLPSILRAFTVVTVLGQSTERLGV